MQNVIILLFVLLASCPGQSPKTEILKPIDTISVQGSTYIWTKVLDSADWKKSYNFQMLNFRNTLWVFHSEGNWFSTNGVNWTKSTLSNSINNLAFLDYVQFNNAIYGLGHFDGNIEKFTFKNEIYKTSDLKQWLTIPGQSNLPTRFFYHPFIFEGKIWIIGGEDKDTKYADIWNSIDAVEWKLQKENAPFGKRSNSQVVSLNGKLFLLGNDVWSSSDGLNWLKTTGEIVKGEEIFGYAAVVFDNKIWLLGCNRNGQFTSKVLVSSDGESWKGQDAPWAPRGGIAATVYNGKVYMTGGKYGGTPNQPDFKYYNDLWTLEKIEK